GGWRQHCAKLQVGSVEVRDFSQDPLWSPEQWFKTYEIGAVDHQETALLRAKELNDPPVVEDFHLRESRIENEIPHEDLIPTHRLARGPVMTNEGSHLFDGLRSNAAQCAELKRGHRDGPTDGEHQKHAALGTRGSCECHCYRYGAEGTNRHPGHRWIRRDEESARVEHYN